MSEGGFVKEKSFTGGQNVKVVNAEGTDENGVSIFPRVLVANLSTESEFWVHLGFNDERNHTSKTYGQLVKAGDPLTVQARFSMRDFWHKYGDPHLEIPATAINESFRQFRSQVLSIWKSPLTKSEKTIDADIENVKKRRIFWLVASSQSGGGGSSECCYWS